MGETSHSSSDRGEESGEFLTTLAAEHTADVDHVRDTLSEAARLVMLPLPYRDVGEVARGGMGAVHRVWDGDLERNVAVKLISQRLTGDPASVQRFVEEARITAQLDHPNIVPVHGLGELPEQGGPCLVMKLVEGKTFKHHLRGLPAPPWSAAQLDEILDIFLKVCDAVSFAHSRGFVHRDLKPENIMVGSFGQVYVMDWGIARPLPKERAKSPQPPSGANTRTPLGTPVYMAPEQALRLEHDIDERTDIFLLGAVLYEILTGRPPHQGPNLVAILYRAITCTILPPQEAAPDRQPPTALSRIAMRALARDAKDRYQTVEELARDVESFKRGEERAPTMVFPPGTPVIVEGQEGTAAYVVVSGRCVVYKMRDGERVVLREMGPGSVFGETAVFTSRPCSATVEALDELTVKVVTRESLAESLGLDTWMGAFVRTLAERFREVDERLRAREMADARRNSEVAELKPKR